MPDIDVGKVEILPDLNTIWEVLWSGYFYWDEDDGDIPMIAGAMN